MVNDIYVAIRVDGNLEIGAGHVFRCINLAKSLSKFGLECGFYSRNLSPNLMKKISHDFDLTMLDKIDLSFKPKDDYSRWLRVSQPVDADDFIAKVASKKCDFVIVDHYGIDFEWETIVKKEIDNLIIVDDLENRRHICDMLIDQSINRKEDAYQALVPDYCSKLLGPRFALLNNSFQNLPKNIEKKYSLLINFGGVDKDNYTMHILDILEKTTITSELFIKVLVGHDYPFLSHLKTALRTSRFMVNLVHNPEDMSFELSECKFAIGAGGVSLLERSSLGIPSILYPIADNQKHICSYYKQKGLGFAFEKGGADEIKNLDLAIKALLEQDTLNEKSVANTAFVDARGISRFTFHVISRFGLLYMRQGRLDDSQFIYECRYNKVDSSFYLNTHMPDYNEHIEWFSEAVLDPKKSHWVCKISNEKVGYARIDQNNNKAELSIYVHDKYRGYGIGKIMLNQICRDFDDVKFYATVHQKNQSSLKVFRSCGFHLLSEENNFLRFVR